MTILKNTVTGITVALALFMAGCASTPNRESIGERVDDSVITTKVKALYVEDKAVSALNINVETFKGTVQLSGFATSPQEINRAVDIARGVKGVESVKNDIVLRTAVAK